MDISYKGLWGYHPLIVSLANTGEVLRLVNRPGNRPFVNYFLRLPAQIVKTGRRLVVRLLGWNSWQPVFFRLVDQFVRPASSRPLRC